MGDKLRGARKRISKEISKEVTNVQAAKKVILESASKVSDAYSAKPIKTNC